MDGGRLSAVHLYLNVLDFMIESNTFFYPFLNLLARFLYLRSIEQPVPNLFWAICLLVNSCPSSMKKSSLLWEISHPDFTAPAYLFGTMHVQDQRAFRFNSIVLEKLADCTAFATEFNLDEAANGMPPATIQLPAGQTYRDYLGPKQLEKLKKIIRQRTNIDIQPFVRLRPLILIQILTSQLLAKEEQYPLDEYLFRQAKAQGKILLGLESFPDQLRILEQLSLTAQFKSLIDISRNFKRFRQQILHTTLAYESGDVQRIFQAAKKSASGMRRVLLYQRNVNMVDAFFTYANQYQLLAAVGAGHLGGKKGMLRLL